MATKSGVKTVLKCLPLSVLLVMAKKQQAKPPKALEKYDDDVLLVKILNFCQHSNCIVRLWQTPTQGHFGILLLSLSIYKIYIQNLSSVIQQSILIYILHHRNTCVCMYIYQEWSQLQQRQIQSQIATSLSAKICILAFLSLTQSLNWLDWLSMGGGAQQIYQVSKLSATVVCFFVLVQTGLWAGLLEQHAPYIQFLPRPPRKCIPNQIHYEKRLTK